MLSVKFEIAFVFLLILEGHLAFGQTTSFGRTTQFYSSAGWIQPYSDSTIPYQDPTAVWTTPIRRDTTPFFYPTFMWTTQDGLYTTDTTNEYCIAPNYHFLCKNSKCLYYSDRCDTYDDCGDGSDEEGCTCDAINNKFLCNNGKCIYSYFLCDMNDNCGDGSDEICPCNDSSKFRCNNGRCLPSYYKCDLVDDCGDGSDEMGCPCNDSSTFRCKNGKCLKSVYKCDFVDQCGDGSDEDGCPCDTSFRCKNNKCIKPELKCNFVDNCGDGSDEKGCFNGTVALTDFFSRKTGNVNVLLNDSNWYQVCLQNWGIVETNVVCRQLGYYTGKLIIFQIPSTRGNDTHFLTNVNCSKNPIPTQLKDCSFDIVKTPCDNRVFLSCSPQKYNLRLVGGRTSSEGRLQIYWEQQWMSFCRYRNFYSYYYSNFSTDDLFCKDLGFAGGMRMSSVNNISEGGNVSITEAYVFCQGYEKSLAECAVDIIPIYPQTCTHDNDIFLRCYQTSSNTSQLPNTFQCSNGNIIDRSCLCDSYSDCMDGGDEFCSCNDTKEHFICTNSECVYRSSVCDRYDSCGDGSDEVGCPCNGSNVFRCNNTRCVYAYSRCNEYDECGDGSDEIGRPCNNVNKFLCNNGRCISNYYKCDLEDNCGDNSDETGCFNSNVALYSGYEKTTGYLIIKINNQWHSVSLDGWTDIESNIACKEFGYSRGRLASYSDVSYSSTVYRLPQVNITCTKIRNTSRIEDCEITTTNQSSAILILKCDNGPHALQLVGGNSSYGRLQFQIDNNWTTVCADGWTLLNSQVACKDLGFFYGILTNNLENTRVGEDVPIGLDGVSCSNSNGNLSDCTHNQYYVHNCRHYEDVFLRCYSTCESTNQRFLCGNGICIDSSRRCNTQNDCGDNSDELNCTCDSLYYNYPCAKGGCVSYNQRCNSIPDCSDGSDELKCCEFQNKYQCPNSSQCIYFSNICNNVSDCPDGSDETGCSTYPKQLRLVGGSESYGRLQIQIGSLWATVCDNSWNPFSSRIACQQLGFRYGTINYNNYNISAGNDVPIGLDDVRCNGTERYITECYHRPYFQHYCNHYYDVFLKCYNACEITNQRFLCGNGNCIDSSLTCNTQNDCGDNSDERNCTCDSSYYIYPCDNGGCVSYNQRCDSIPDCSDGSDELKCCEFQNNYQCPNSTQCIYFSCICNNVSDCSDGSEEVGCSTYPKPIRLVGGSETYGRLQIQIGSVWATVCDDSWNTFNSRIACQQLGFRYGTLTFFNNNNSTGNDAPIGLDDVQCNGTERYITDCYHSPYFQHDCSHYEDIFLTCYNSCESTNQSFLCKNGNCIDSSRKCNTQNDCGDNSDELNCTCDSSYYIYPCGDGGCVSYNQICNSIPDCSDGSDELKCGCEFQIKYQCPHSTLCIHFSNVCNNISECPDGSDEVGCYTYPKPLRLVGGSETFGLLQIQIGIVWATVCNDYWNEMSSRLACQQLGFRIGTTNYNNNNILAENSAPIGLDDVQCNGTERYITECYHRPYFKHNCDHSQDVYLTCFNNSVQETTRGVPGTSKSISTSYNTTQPNSATPAPHETTQREISSTTADIKTTATTAKPDNGRTSTTTQLETTTTENSLIGSNASPPWWKIGHVELFLCSMTSFLFS